jgi:putative membrane protein
MISYDPHKWFDHFFDIRGSLVREISGRVLSCLLWTAAVVAFHKHVRDVSTSPALHSLAGVALGMLLVFRTNASYDRFWEGRKLWGGLVNETRNLIRASRVHFGKEAPALLAELTRWTCAYPWACMHALRGTDSLGPCASELPKAEVDRGVASQHTPLAVAGEMTRCLRQARDQGLISDIVLTALDQNIQQLIDYQGACERIRKTPMPFAYVVHLRRALVLYCFTLPFALVKEFGWATVPDVAVLSYVLFGIEEIGVEIEGPFGHDANDLPLEEICTTIQKNLFALGELGPAERERLPEGL